MTANVFNEESQERIKKFMQKIELLRLKNYSDSEILTDFVNNGKDTREVEEAFVELKRIADTGHSYLKNPEVK